MRKRGHYSRQSNNPKERIIYFLGILLVLLIASMVLFLMQRDYTNKIVGLSSEFDKKLEQKQNQIDNLYIKLEETNQQLTESNMQYELEIGELNQKLGDLAVESESFSSIIADVIDATVTISTDVGQGSGAIITKEGHIITNYHVIQGARRATIYDYSGEAYGVGLLGYNIKEDIAILKIVSNNSFDYFEFGDSDELVAGQKVVALGNPAGLSFTATEGIISSPSRFISGREYIQTDVTINPGNSGGPLIDSNGDIIGIVNFKISNFEELGFAIPSDRAKNIAEDILS